jgi:hypothetical protein
VPAEVRGAPRTGTLILTSRILKIKDRFKKYRNLFKIILRKGNIIILANGKG